MPQPNCNPILDFQPFGDGCDAIGGIKAALERIGETYCEECNAAVLSTVVESQFVDVGWGGIENVPGQCHTLWVQRSDGRIYMSFDRDNEWATWSLIYDPLTANSIPPRYQYGLQVNRYDDNTILVGVGDAVVDGTLATKNTLTLLALGTAGNWIGGVSGEANNQYIHVYMDKFGNLRLHNHMPNYSHPSTNNRAFVGRVNQAGWVGTTGLGLNATSIVYDTDTGEDNIRPGMLLGVYTDANYTTGRGRGTSGGGNVNNASFALITAVNTGTNTITVEAGHNIALRDNDYLIAIEHGELMYRLEGATWWRHLGMVWNGNSGLLSNSRFRDVAATNLSGASDPSTTSTSFTDVDSVNLTLTILANGKPMEIGFYGSGISNGNYGYINFSQDYLGVVPNDGILAFYNVITPLSFVHQRIGVLPGTHIYNLQWKVASGGTATLYAASTLALAMRPHFSVRVTP
jgi:hypothetical protein